MDSPVSPTPTASGRRSPAQPDQPAVAAWVLAFVLVFYLALSNGGYDTIVRSQVGVAVAISLLAGFALWTGLAAGWSESPARGAIELGRVATYLGVLVLAVALQAHTAARHTINGLACAIGVVTLLAVLSRLHPHGFPSAIISSSSARRALASSATR